MQVSLRLTLPLNESPYNGLITKNSPSLADGSSFKPSVSRKPGEQEVFKGSLWEAHRGCTRHSRQRLLRAAAKRILCWSRC